MTESPEATQAAPAKKRAGGLNSMLLADLKAMAAGMGVRGAGSMKKADLIEAIKSAQSAQSGQATTTQPPAAEESRPDTRQQQAAGQAERAEPREQQPQQERGQQDQPKQDQPKQDQPKQDQPKQDQPKQDQPKQDQPKQGGGQQGQRKQPKQDSQKQQGQQKQQDQQKQQGQQAKDEPKKDEPEGSPEDGDGADGGDGEGGSRRNRRRRGRDRSTRAAGREPDTTILEDDVVVPAAGILDVLDNYAFVRTGGYTATPDDVYLSLSMVRKYGLRPGDAIVGQVRHPREGERREKFNPMVRIDSVNGVDPEQAKNRPEFAELTPVHPADRLRMETGREDVTGRMIDLAAPIGKGQRGLIVSPPHAGKTATLRAIATSVAANNPECHLMVVLVDERPEEVTDFERSVRGEVIASTFDRPAADHVTVAELAIQRAQRLVELGHDVVVLLDGITRLARAYNLALPATGRVLAGGVDAGALYPAKRLFGAARNIEEGGSLTVLATISQRDSATDEVILEEFAGTENLELRLRGDLAEAGQYPAVDVVNSSTRREDLLVTGDEGQILGKLRAELAELEPRDAQRSLVERLHRTHTNIELLMQVQRG